MKGDTSLFKHIGMKNPPVLLITMAVGTGLGFLGFMGYHKVTKDRSLILNKHNNPKPWLNTRQDENLKLYAVNAKFTNPEVKPHF
jgi:hypothetical protein